MCEDDWIELGNQCAMILILGDSVFFNDRTLALDLTRLGELRVPLAIWGGVQNPWWLQTEEGRERTSRLTQAATRVYYRFPGETEVLQDLVPDELPVLCRALGEHHELLAAWCEASDADHYRGLLPGARDICDYAHVLAVLRNCSAVMGSRLHPLVVGASQNVPALGWEIGTNKIRWFMDALGTEDALIDVQAKGLTADAVVEALESLPARQAECGARALSLAEAARRALDWMAGELGA